LNIRGYVIFESKVSRQAGGSLANLLSFAGSCANLLRVAFSHIILSASVLASFEKELKNKLSQKASGVQSEEQVLLKAFKYFDLNNNGTVEPEEFAKAIEKIGIMIPTRQVSPLSVKRLSSTRCGQRFPTTQDMGRLDALPISLRKFLNFIYCL
jgi:hypothetical protein